MTQLERNLIAFARAKLLRRRFNDALELLAEIRMAAG